MLSTPEEWNPLSYRIVGCCLSVHRNLGPGLLESIYEDCLALEFQRQSLSFERQHPVPVTYFEEVAGDPLRLDFLVEDTIIVEIKAIEQFQQVHTAQVLTYLKLTKRPLGLLINFNTAYLRSGIKRVILTV